MSQLALHSPVEVDLDELFTWQEDVRLRRPGRRPHRVEPSDSPQPEPRRNLAEERTTMMERMLAVGAPPIDDETVVIYVG